VTEFYEQLINVVQSQA